METTLSSNGPSLIEGQRVTNASFTTGAENVNPLLCAVRQLLATLHKLQSGCIHAVAQAGWSGAIFEDVTQVRLTLGTKNFGPHLSQAGVDLVPDILPGNRRPEAWPSGSGVKFCVGAEQGIVATDAAVTGSLPVAVIARSAELRTEMQLPTRTAAAFAFTDSVNVVLSV